MWYTLAFQLFEDVVATALKSLNIQSYQQYMSMEKHLTSLYHL